MDERNSGTTARLRRLRSLAQEMAERSAELHREVHGAIRELRDLARKSLQRRRYGDGKD